MIMLRYADELKDAAPFFDEVPSAKPDKEMVDLAVELINRKSGTFKPAEFETLRYGTQGTHRQEDEGADDRCPSRAARATHARRRSHGGVEEEHRRGGGEAAG